MANCNLTEAIFDNVNVTCDVTEGFEEEAMFILRSDVDFATLKSYESSTLANTYVVPEGGKILKDGKKGAVVVQLKNPFSGTTSEFAEGDVRNTITNTVSMNVWSSDPQASKQLDAMLNSTYVCIVKQLYKGDEDNSGYVGGAKYRMYGVTGSGLKCTGMSNDPYSDTISNGWTVTFQETGALNSMKFLQAVGTDSKASETATDALFESMKTE